MTPLDRLKELERLQTELDTLKSEEHTRMNIQRNMKSFKRLQETRKMMRILSGQIHELLRTKETE